MSRLGRESSGESGAGSSGGSSGGWRQYLPWIDAAAFTVSGVIHLVRPSVFTPIVPHFLPVRTELVYASGVAELVCAVGLWRRDRWAGIASAALLVAIWPANLQQAITALGGQNMVVKVLSWARFPLQIPLIWFALQSGKEQAARGRGSSPAPAVGAATRAGGSSPAPEVRDLKAGPRDFSPS